MQRQIHGTVTRAAGDGLNLGSSRLFPPPDGATTRTAARQHQPDDGSRDGCAKPSRRNRCAGAGHPPRPAPAVLCAAGTVGVTDSSGDIAGSGISGNVEVLADGSGQVRVTAVKGEVRLP